MISRILPLMVMGLLALPVAHAALNPVLPYEDEGEYITSFDELSNVLSGQPEMDVVGAHNGTVLLGADEFSISGLTRLYWGKDGGGSDFAAGTNLRIEVAQNSSIALRHPGEYNYDYGADYALSFFADASALFGASKPENLGFGPSLVSFPVAGEANFDLGILPATPFAGSSFNDFVDESALLLTFTPGSMLTLFSDDGNVRTVLSGEGRWVGFQGTPQVDPVQAQVMALPTPDGTTTDFQPAADEAAAEGLSAENLATVLATLSASEGSDLSAVEGLQDVTEGLSAVLNGAYLGIDATNGTGGAAALLQSATVVRFNSLSATRDGDQLHLEGRSPLQIQNGAVVGANPLVGIFPWWSLLLWAVALGLFVLRVVVRPSAKHPVWDKFSWVGLVGGVAAALIVFWLWDAETKALWGTSMFSSGSSGVSLGIIALVQLLPLALAGLAIGLPTRMIVKSGTRFAGQGNFMRVGAIVAPFMVLLLGAGLMLDYLDLLIGAIARFG